MRMIRIYEKLFGNVMALNRYLRMQYIIPEIMKIKDSKVLDIGCLDGDFTRYFTGRTNKVIAIDIRDYGIRQRLPGVLFSIASGQFLPFADNCFDYVFCSDVFEHVEDFEKIVPEIHRVLKPGKTCLVSTVDGYWQSPVRLRSFFLKYLPVGLTTFLMGKFAIPDQTLHRNFMGHVRYDITSKRLEETFWMFNLIQMKRRTYCHNTGSILMEIFYSFNETIRYFIFPFLKLLLPLDKWIVSGKPWQYYMVFEKR